jgi:hypothetical protein
MVNAGSFEPGPPVATVGTLGRYRPGVSTPRMRSLVGLSVPSPRG